MEKIRDLIVKCNEDLYRIQYPIKRIWLEMRTKKNNLRMTLIAASGSTLETYEFVIFAMLAPYISQIFFGYDPNHTQALAAFAIGYIARPIGGIIFGLIGDIYGRRISFSYSLIIIACATLGIALLPGYDSIGLAAPCILICLRGCQGISYGAELAGAITLVREYAPAHRRGLYLSLLMICVSLGSFLASGLIYTLKQTSIPMEAYGWRIPFLVGGIGGLFAFYVRKTLQESPEFLNLKNSKKEPNVAAPLSQPLRILMRDYKPQLLCTFGLNTFLTMIAMLYFYLPTYLITYASYDSASVFGMVCLAFLGSIFPAIGGGILADKGYKLPTMIGVICVFMFLLIPIHAWLFESPSLWALFAGVALFDLAYLIYWPSFSVFVTDAFPVQVRYTAIASTYNLTYSFVSLLPMGLAFSFKNGFNPWVLPTVAIALSVFTLGTIMYAWKQGLSSKPVDLPEVA
jgi:MFS family permease